VVFLKVFLVLIFVCFAFTTWVSLYGLHERLMRLEASTKSKFTFTATIHSMDAIIPPQWIRSELHGKECRVSLEVIDE
jgi:hypothetical protein